MGPIRSRFFLPSDSSGSESESESESDVETLKPNGFIDHRTVADFSQDVGKTPEATRLIFDLSGGFAALDLEPKPSFQLHQQQKSGAQGDIDESSSNESSESDDDASASEEEPFESGASHFGLKFTPINQAKQTPSTPRRKAKANKEASDYTTPSPVRRGQQQLHRSPTTFSPAFEQKMKNSMDFITGVSSPNKRLNYCTKLNEAFIQSMDRGLAEEKEEEREEEKEPRVSNRLRARHPLMAQDQHALLRFEGGAPRYLRALRRLSSMRKKASLEKGQAPYTGKNALRSKLRAGAPFPINWQHITKPDLTGGWHAVQTVEQAAKYGLKIRAVNVSTGVCIGDFTNIKGKRKFSTFHPTHTLHSFLRTQVDLPEGLPSFQTAADLLKEVVAADHESFRSDFEGDDYNNTLLVRAAVKGTNMWNMLYLRNAGWTSSSFFPVFDVWDGVTQDSFDLPVVVSEDSMKSAGKITKGVLLTLISQAQKKPRKEFRLPPLLPEGAPRLVMDVASLLPTKAYVPKGIYFIVEESQE